jgi:DNA mismatch endonuclease, patch repair protein
MRANRQESGAEVKFRKAVWAEGARGFRRGNYLPGRPDLVFPAVRLAVFVHGCYWHRCPVCAPRDVKANPDFWRSKFVENLRRDAAAQAALESSGWEVAIVWEHEIRADIGEAARRIAEQLIARHKIA